MKKAGTVDALELLVLFVAQPVGSGDRRDLEGFDTRSRRDVRAATEVRKVAVAIDGDRIAGPGELLDEVNLHELALLVVVGEALFARLFFADELLIACYDLMHARLDGGEVSV